MYVKIKKILVLSGTPHENSFTAELNKYFLGHMNMYGLSCVSYIDSYKATVKPCIDCKICRREQTCVFHDMDEIDKLLRESDIIVISTPVYNMSFPAPLKAIFDRFQRYYSARFYMNIKPPIKKHKKAILLATCGSEDLRGIEIMKLQLERIFTIMNTELIDTIVWSGTDNKNFDIQAYKKKTEKKIIKFLDSI